MLAVFLLPVALIDIIFLGLFPQVGNRRIRGIPHLPTIRLSSILQVFFVQILEVPTKQRLLLRLLVDHALIHIREDGEPSPKGWIGLFAALWGGLRVEGIQFEAFGEAVFLVHSCYSFELQYYGHQYQQQTCIMYLFFLRVDWKVQRFCRVQAKTGLTTFCWRRLTILASGFSLGQKPNSSFLRILSILPNLLTLVLLQYASHFALKLSCTSCMTSFQLLQSYPYLAIILGICRYVKFLQYA